MTRPLRPFKQPKGEHTTEANGRRIVRERSGGLCELALPDLCLGRAAGVHHRIKRGQGGTWAPSNLLDACGSGTMGCHGWVEAHPKDANAIGLWLHANDDSLLVPAMVRWAGQRSRWFLEDDGTLRWDDAEDNDFVDILWGPGAVTTPPTPWGQ
jgi:hypothetical protein